MFTSRLVQYGTRGKCPYVYSTQQSLPSLSEQSHATGPVVQTLDTQSVRRYWVWSCAKVHHSAFSCVAAKRNLTDEDIMELALELDLDDS
jgi:hypothetical protein